MKRINLLLVILGLFTTQLYAQIKVSGTVTDDTNSPVWGASVVVKGKTTSTATDAKGNFSLIANKGDILVFKFMGMDPKEKKIETAILNVEMKPSDFAINEVVAIGYGSVRKSDLTGSVGSIKSEDIMRSSPVSLDQGLQGRLAGVFVQQMDGAPGGGMSIQIRGANSFSGGTEPLYVIDDIPYEANSSPNSSDGDMSKTNPLSMINPGDIESVEVLKDASSTAIYGSRGANGVVLIKTKQGRAGETKIELNVNKGWSFATNTIDVLPGEAYAKLFNEARINADRFDSNAGFLAGNNMKYFDVFGTKSGMNMPEYYRNNSSDWQNMIFQNGDLTDVTLSLSGGTEKTTYMVSGNIIDQKGILTSSAYKRGSLRINLQGQINSRISFGVSSNLSYADNRFVKTGSDVGQAGGVVRSALRYPSVYTAMTPAGDIADEWYDASNPLAYVLSQKNMVEGYKSTVSGYLEGKLTQDLKLRIRVGTDLDLQRREQYLPAGTRESKNGKAYYSDNLRSNIVNENLLTYSKIFDKIHNLNIVIAETQEIGNGKNRSNQVTGFINDYLQDNAMQTASEMPVIYNGRSMNTLASALGRINYSLLNRYLLTASYRADGSSKFAKNNKWAYFPSAAVAWKASEEKFLKDLNVFSNLKLRLSYGETGNQGISSYGSLTSMSAVKYPFEELIQVGTAIQSNGLGNDNLTWETTRQYNVGADFGFFNNILNLTVDLYRKNTSNLLQQQELPLSLGYNRRWMNMGSLRNDGLEITLGAYPVKNELFTWKSDFNISFNRNKITSLGKDIPSQTVLKVATDVEPFRLVVGRPLGDIYAYKTLGVYQNLEQVKADGLYVNDPATQNFMVGEYRYMNASNLTADPAKDFILNSDDIGVVGNTNPDYIFGFSNSFTYNNFDLSFFVQGVIGNDIVNTTSWSMLSNIGGSSSNITWEAYHNLWRGEGTSNLYPKAVESKKRLVLFSDRYVEDGSYIRLKSVNLGYNFNVARTSFFQKLRVSVIASNLLTLTKYSGFDPEVNAFNADPARRGVDMGNYPLSRTVSVNLTATF